MLPFFVKGIIMELTHVDLQTVEPNRAVLFDAIPVRSNGSVLTRQGSGLVTLRGPVGCGCNMNTFARYEVTFGANVSIPTGGTVGPISVSLALSGEPVAASEMIVTPAAVEEPFNVNRTTYINVPAGCCSQLSVENTGDEAIDVQAANLVVRRTV